MATETTAVLYAGRMFASPEEFKKEQQAGRDLSSTDMASKFRAQFGIPFHQVRKKYPDRATSQKGGGSYDASAFGGLGDRTGDLVEFYVGRSGFEVYAFNYSLNLWMRG